MKLKLTLFCLCVTGLSSALAAPTPKSIPSKPYEYTVTCKTTVKDTNGNTIANRTYSDHGVGTILLPQKPGASCWHNVFGCLSF